MHNFITGPSESKDISALIAEEVAELKDESKKRFAVHHTSVKGCVFICFPRGSGAHIHAQNLKRDAGMLSARCNRACAFTCFPFAARVHVRTHSAGAGLGGMLRPLSQPPGHGTMLWGSRSLRSVCVCVFESVWGFRLVRTPSAMCSPNMCTRMGAPTQR